MSCANHSDKPGQFQCVSCKIVLCNQCVKSFQAGGFFTYFCPACNSQCEEIDEKQSPAGSTPAPSPEKILQVEKKIPVPVQEKKIKIEEQKVELQPEESLPEDIPSPKPSESTPAGRKIIKLETDNLDEIPVQTGASSVKLSQAPSVLEGSAVSAEIKTPSFLGYFLTLFFKPESSFKTMAIQMQRSMPLKLQSLFAVVIFLSLLICIRFQNHPFTFSMLSSLSDTLLFLFFFTLFSIPSDEIKSKVNLGMCGITFFLFLQTLHIALVHALTSMTLTHYVLYSGLAFIPLKLWIFFKGFQCFNDKGGVQNLLYTLIVFFSQGVAESAFFQWFYI